jgi:dynein heavy chain
VFKINKTNINAKGEIENWLKVLEISMDETLRKQIARGFIEYEQSRDRVNFIKDRLSQVALLICQVNWTLDTEAFIDNLDDYYRLSLKQLTELTSLIRDPDLADQTRRTLVALITQDVHNRDIVEELMEIEGITKEDFSWSKQLRFYMEGDGF